MVAYLSTIILFQLMLGIGFGHRKRVFGFLLLHALFQLSMSVFIIKIVTGPNSLEYITDVLRNMPGIILLGHLGILCLFMACIGSYGLDRRTLEDERSFRKRYLKVAIPIILLTTYVTTLLGT